MSRLDIAEALLDEYDPEEMFQQLEGWSLNGQWPGDAPEWVRALAEALHVGFSAKDIIVAGYRHVAKCRTGSKG